MMYLSFVKYRTLSPVDSFSSELGIHFDTVYLAPHVIRVDCQVLINALYLPTNSKTACVIFNAYKIGRQPTRLTNKKQLTQVIYLFFSSWTFNFNILFHQSQIYTKAVQEN